MRAVPILRDAPPGVVVAVGSERCLLAPVVNEDISHVVMADHDARVVYYNEINLALIGACCDRHTYGNLRFAPTFDDFVARLDAIGYRRRCGDLIDLRQQRHFDFFRAAQSRSGFRHYNASDGPFAELSYVHSDAAFSRIKGMVDQGRIVTRKYDVAAPSSIGVLERELNDAGLRISVMDISNCWWDNYVSLERSCDRTFVLGPNAFADGGLVLVTDRDYGKPWYYVAFKRRQLVELAATDDASFAGLFSQGPGRRQSAGRRSGNLKKVLGVDCMDQIVDLSPRLLDSCDGTSGEELLQAG